MKLLTVENAKTKKGESLGYLTGILYLAPANMSGRNLCPKASAGCKAACLNSAGRGQFDSIQRARLDKTLLFNNNLPGFIEQLKEDIQAVIRKAEREGLKPAIRLNGTSDIMWDRITDIIQSFPEVQFYDYTKISSRFTRQLPANYHLTFSLSETNFNEAVEVLKLGYNVAAVFFDVPSKFIGFEVINGDNHDLRFLDKKGVVVGLTAKGKAKKDTSGFVQFVEQNNKLAA